MAGSAWLRDGVTGLTESCFFSNNNFQKVENSETSSYNIEPFLLFNTEIQFDPPHKSTLMHYSIKAFSEFVCDH